jgi:hypothetical protein
MWQYPAFGGGTVAQSSGVRLPYYYVYADDKIREHVARTLVEWLNEGRRPVWANSLHREGPLDEFVRGEDNICITATGPMIMLEDGTWAEDPTWQLNRIALIDLLLE